MSIYESVYSLIPSEAPHRQTFQNFFSKNLIAELFTLDDFGNDQTTQRGKKFSTAQLEKN